MPTEAYAHGGLCPMPTRTSYESSKGYMYLSECRSRFYAQTLDLLQKFTLS